MRNTIVLLLALIGFLNASNVAHAEDHVQVAGIANVTAIQPGTPFMLGFKFTIDPGWHIYWKNYGDTGIPTDVKLNLPPGFTAEPLMYPVPKRIQLPGDMISYVYEDQVMLMVQVTPPKDLPVGKDVSISANASWLMCKEECVPGKGEVAIKLPVTTDASPANADVFSTWTKQLPLKSDAADISTTSSTMSLTNGDGTATLNIGWKKVPTDVQFLPGPMDDGFTQNIKVNTSNNSTAITFDVKGLKGSAPVTGLVAFTTESGTRTAIEVAIPTGSR